MTRASRRPFHNPPLLMRKDPISLEITRNRKARMLWLDQQLYIKDLLIRFKIDKSNAVPTQMDSSRKLSKIMGIAPTSSTQYRLYEKTRDILKSALGTLKGILKYPKETSHYNLQFNNSLCENLEDYSDADWAVIVTSISWQNEMEIYSRHLARFL
uniref:Uncharacterized protein n=1 Tax=Glossina pallidipes TaxID=7398 RepID=A0A1A9ZNL8_GLOPL